MAQKNLRTYRRRGATRESGYHTCEETTGGECRILHAERYVCDSNTVTFRFSRSSLELVELFDKGISIIAFGGYIFSKYKAVVSLNMSNCYEGQGYAYGEEWEKVIEGDSWTNIGAHVEQIIDRDSRILDVIVDIRITSQKGNTLDFVSFDFDVISKDEFIDTSCAESFYQKTYMHIPYLYYLRSDLPKNSKIGPCAFNNETHEPHFYFFIRNKY